DPNYPWRGQKAEVWEGGTRVPFIARWPTRVSAGGISERQISLVDLIGTMADIIGFDLPIDQALDSYSFLPILSGSEEQYQRPYVVTGTRGMTQLAIRKEKWKLIFEPEVDKVALYNLI